MVPVGDTGAIPYGMAASFLGAHSDSRPDAGDGCVNKMRAAVGIPSTPCRNAAFMMRLYQMSQDQPKALELTYHSLGIIV